MPNCFIAEYWREMQERKNGSKNTTLDGENLKFSGSGKGKGGGGGGCAENM